MSCANNTGVETCNNPCGTSPGNTAQCESLPSQIENFTLQFFGTVVKTEINGKVTWSLPCGLDVGLPANPRGVDEGLACYFLRLFADGIGGLQGPKGVIGDAGEDGHNAYSILVQSFTQPSLASPLVQFVILANPSILAGLYVFVQNSGYYLVTSADSSGVIFATLVSPKAGALTTIPVGSIVVPTGPPGA
jgi:hypothetical protein